MLQFKSIFTLYRHKEGAISTLMSMRGGGSISHGENYPLNVGFNCTGAADGRRREGSSNSRCSYLGRLSACLPACLPA
jgi:hypothetical protein